jgi:enamine deaminase RidA (YjgF/YER057c/UK114 family)
MVPPAHARRTLRIAYIRERRTELLPRIRKRRTSQNLPSTHSGEFNTQTDYDSYHTRASKVKEKVMIDRTIAPGLSQPPGSSHVVVAGDRHAQTRQTLENLTLALEAVGAAERDVIKMTVYVVAGERADLGAVWVAVQESGRAGTASTLLGVSMLAVEGQLVEIEAIAVLE